jgi:hypothetical protein
MHSSSSGPTKARKASKDFAQKSINENIKIPTTFAKRILQKNLTQKLQDGISSYSYPLFAHISDLHISSTRSETIDAARNLLQKIYKYQPYLLINTGDALNVSAKASSSSNSLEDNWKIYLTLLEEAQRYSDGNRYFSFFDYVEALLGQYDDPYYMHALGDQDLFGISNTHQLQKFMMNIVEEGEGLQKKEILDKPSLMSTKKFQSRHGPGFRIEEDQIYCKLFNYRETFSVIVINELSFPRVQPYYDYLAHPSRHQLDLIEKVLNAAYDPCIVVCHYPVDYHWDMKSSQGHTFAEIMENPKIYYILTGHEQVDRPKFIHRGQGALEIIGGYGTKGFGLVTAEIISDSNNEYVELVYHYIDADEPQQGFITYPVPLNQITSRHHLTSFSSAKDQIEHSSAQKKVLSDSDDPSEAIPFVFYLDPELVPDSSTNKNVKLQTLGSIPDPYLCLVDTYTKCQCPPSPENSQNFYSLKCYVENLNEGYHRVSFQVREAKFSIEQEFYVGKRYRAPDEQSLSIKRGIKSFRIAAILLWVNLLVILLPIKGIQLDSLNIRSEFKALLLGTLVIRERIHVAPLKVRLFLLFSLIYPIFLPIHIFENKGVYGCSIACFIYSEGKFRYDDWALFLSTLFILAVVLPSIFVLSSYSSKTKGSVHSFNVLFMIICLLVSYYINYSWVGQWFLLSLPAFIIFPIIILNLFISNHIFGSSERRYVPLDNSE